MTGTRYHTEVKMREWDKAQIEQLHTLVAEGLSAAQIARRIPGATRSSVLGKVRRLGLVLAQARQDAAGKSSGQRVNPAARGNLIRHATARAAEPCLPAPARSVSLMERTGCAFPVGRVDGEHKFCNDHKESGSYCAAHRKVMYAGQKQA